MFKFQPEEFIVEEILDSGEVLALDEKFQKPDEALKDRNHYFSKFVLQKRLWTTNNAIRQIADRLHISATRINFAGNKDRNAITTQLCSAFAVEPSKLLSLNIKDIRINGAWLSNEGVKLGHLAGNRFTITISETNSDQKIFKKAKADKILKKTEKNNFAIPNYFGEQRFGSARKNTAEVGKLLLLGKFKEAVLNYLTYTDEIEKDEGARAARKRLAKEMNFREALHYFPHFLKTEKLLLSHLLNLPNDYLGAYRRLHRSMQLLFIHAYQSELFNKILEQRAKKNLFKPGIGDYYCLLDTNGFPKDGEPLKIENKETVKDVIKLIAGKKAVLLGNIVGFQSELNKAEEKLLKKEGIAKDAFLMRSTPELSGKGTFRPLFVFLKDFDAKEEGMGKTKVIRLRFSLPAGSYATVALKEIIS